MNEHVHDTIYVDEDSNFHRVSSTIHKDDGKYVGTFCGEQFGVTDKSRITSVPISILDKNGICIVCERNHSHIQYDRFNSYNNGDYKFFLQFSIRTGKNRSKLVRDTVCADNIKKAKEIVKNKNNMTEIHRYDYISKSENYGDWEVLVDNRTYKPEA